VSGSAATTERTSSPSKWRELSVGLLLIVFAHACDILSTYLRTPDLSREVGPAYLLLVSKGLGGWGALLGIKLVGVLLSVSLFVYYMRNRRYFYPPDEGMIFHDFLHYTHGKEALRGRDGRWLAPSPKLLAVWMAFTVAIGTAAYAYFLAWHNIMATPLLTRMADSLAPAAIFMVSAVVFWQTLYHDYRRGGVR
jgi:hypothetical protein